MMQNYSKNPKPARNETKFNNTKKWRNRLDYTTSLIDSYFYLSLFLENYLTSSKSKASVNQLLAEKRQNARRTRQLTDSAMLITLLRKVRLFPPNFQENLRVFNKKIIST